MQYSVCVATTYRVYLHMHTHTIYIVYIQVQCIQIGCYKICKGHSAISDCLADLMLGGAKHTHVHVQVKGYNMGGEDWRKRGCTPSHMMCDAVTLL